jgi:hypothetical protein
MVACAGEKRNPSIKANTANKKIFLIRHLLVKYLVGGKKERTRGNPAVSRGPKDPWLSVPASKRVWLYWLMHQFKDLNTEHSETVAKYIVDFA